jgi:hypothetical protein
LLLGTAHCRTGGLCAEHGKHIVQHGTILIAIPDETLRESNADCLNHSR